MDNRKFHHRTNPKFNANILSRLFLCWMFPFISYGYRHGLEMKDMFQLAPKEDSEYLGDKFEKCWEAEVREAKEKKRRPKLWKVIMKIFGSSYFTVAITAFVGAFPSVFIPLVLQLLILHFNEKSSTTMLDGCAYGLLLVVTLLVYRLAFIHPRLLMRNIGQKVKSACSSVIYRKLLRVHINCQGRFDRGRMITLLSNDVSRFEGLFEYLPAIIVVPTVLITNGIIIWRALGPTVVSVIFFSTLLNIPLSVFCAFLMVKLREKVAEKTDRRLLLIEEVISGIRVIKMYTWEKPLELLILLIRRKEVDFVIKKLFLNIGTQSYLIVGYSATLYLTIITLLAHGDKVNSLIVFPLTHFCINMQVQMGSRVSECLSRLAEAKAAINRIEDFLLLEEVASVLKLCSSNDSKVVVTLKDVTVSWSKTVEHDILKNINISLAPKKLYALVGETASGKSSLLKVILGELNPKSGQVSTYGRISFANQEPWIFNGSIRSNILLGELFDEEKYNEVVKSCALLKDFDQLPHGDKTVVGEHVAALSGGQSARVNLARAVYRNADIYLLDDPLASIDYCVGKCLFEKCINGLLKDKTRVLVTHKLEYIKNVDEVILINNGRIEHQGNYDSFRKTDYFKYLARNRELDMSPGDKDKLSQDSINSFVNVDVEEDEIQESNYKSEELLRLKPYADSEDNVEPMKQGKIPCSILAKFYNNKCLMACVLVSTLLLQVFYAIFEYFLAMWAENQDKYLASLNSTNLDHYDTKFNLSDSQMTLFYAIGGVLLGMFVLFIVRLIFCVRLHRESCENTHRTMISTLLGTTIRFFDVNDSGRILNRFSRDTGIVDEHVPVIIAELIRLLFLTILSGLPIVIKSAYISIPVIILTFSFLKILFFFGPSIRLAKRLEAGAKASVLSHTIATFNGLITIRSAGAHSMVQKNFNVYQDNYMTTCFTNIYIFYSYLMWTDLILYTILIFVVFSFIFAKSTGVSSATVGYVMTELLLIIRVFSLIGEGFTKLDTLMVSTERIYEYTELEQETDAKKIGLIKSVKNWPNKGVIKFDHLYLKYSNSTHSVLNNINFIVEPRAKIGIIGRTGAGKSSLVTALFRLTETSGSLYVDDIDTNTVALKDLRRNISILPQKSTLFSTSLRKNLDPLELFDDAKIWSALKCVQLEKIFQSLDEELNVKSLSSGQCQLLCLARATLKKNKILILDEATANVDSQTDDLINKIIRDNFKDCTVLTIAHKLNSVIDCDKILVVDGGRVIEYDEPRVLLNQKNSYFYKMWKEFHHSI